MKYKKYIIDEVQDLRTGNLKELESDFGIKFRFNKKGQIAFQWPIVDGDGGIDPNWNSIPYLRGIANKINTICDYVEEQNRKD